MADEITNDQREKIQEKLQWESALQRATQEINDHWEARTAKMKSLFDLEMQNLLTGGRTFSKPKFIDRIRGRYRDHYILFNNKVPMVCESCGHQTQRGVDFGIEAICLSAEQALAAADEYWKERKEYNGYSFNSLSIIHFQVDRFGSRHGMIVRDITIQQKDWNADKKKTVKAELDKITADELVLDSLMSMRPKKRR
ncbi:MAG: hypothetical protein CMA60_00160 [Euryarchaeota archaeon]|nr:hypothetical protein [Euryarchaeota archaeon]|tara:strand:+ start:1014 stop:1604 length:591 start_codon:yes stop_codon:yes gene_type:complete